MSSTFGFACQRSIFPLPRSWLSYKLHPLTPHLLRCLHTPCNFSQGCTKHTPFSLHTFFCLQTAVQVVRDGDAKINSPLSLSLSLSPSIPPSLSLSLSFRRERGFQITHDLLFSGERKFLFSREIRWGDLFHLFQFQGRSIINFCQKRSVAILQQLKEPTSQINNASEPVFPQGPGNSSKKSKNLNQTWLFYRFLCGRDRQTGQVSKALCVFFL